MNPFFQQIIISTILTYKNRTTDQNKIKKEKKLLTAPYQKKSIKREISNSFLLLAGIVSAGFGLKGFLLPNNFIDGGITGISLLCSKLSGLSFPDLMVVLNIPFIIIGYNQFGINFVIKTTFGVIGLALCIAMVNYPVITSDKLLVSVFGGFFIGCGIGLAVKSGGVLDGTETMSLYLSKKTKLTIGDIILVFNLTIFSLAACFLSLETVLYSILAYLSASKTIDFILGGIDEYTGVTIISVKSGEIRKMVTDTLGNGVTVYKGSSGYGKTGHQLEERDILYSVITRLEVSRFNLEIEKIDPNAFVVMNSVKDTRGGMIRKKKLQ